VVEPIGDVAERLTLDEKVALVSGADCWRTTGIDRIGLAPMLLSDGPTGVRGTSYHYGFAVSVPCGTALAASWNPEAVHAIGALLGREATRKHVDVLLAPMVNMIRSPLAGRAFECYSEDPLLTSRVAAAFIQGVQSRGVAATVKHLLANESETRRQTVSSIIDERALREIYLRPFEAAVRDADVACVMASYNRVDGVHVCESPAFLTGLLKDEWGFDGAVISDWFAMHSTVPTALAGVDLEMPGPPTQWGEKLLAALADGEVSEAELNSKVERILRLAERTGNLGGTSRGPSATAPNPDRSASADVRRATSELLRATAADCFVLLRNDDQVLPLNGDELASLAVVGPFASSVAQGGGSALVKQTAPVSPLAGLTETLPGAEVRYEPGCFPHGKLPFVPPPGARFTVELFDRAEATGEPVLTETSDHGMFIWDGDFVTRFPPGDCALRVSYDFVPEQSGHHLFGVTAMGDAVLRVDGADVAATSTAVPTSWVEFVLPERTASVELAAGRRVRVEAEFVPGRAPISEFSLGYLPPVDEDDAIARAAAVAADSDAAVVVVGLGTQWETEGKDRPDLALPGRQNELVRRVLEANPRTVVVVCAGTPIDMPWIERAGAVLYAWYPGQELGHALADVLVGAAEPGGRLPMTFPATNDQVVSTIPDGDDVLRYDESVFIGHRAYDRDHVDPLFCFGHGLGYGRVHFDDMTLEQTDGEVTVTVRLRNVSGRTTSEVVQVYVSPASGTPVDRPPLELKGSQKTRLEPGETGAVRLVLDRRAFSYWDTDRHAWHVQPGRYGIHAGRSSRDLPLTATIDLP